MSNSTTISITENSSDEMISEVAKVISVSFGTLPVFEYFVRVYTKLPFSEPIDKNKLYVYFIYKLKGMIEHGYVVEAVLSDDGSGKIVTAAAWAPPGKDTEKFDSEFEQLSGPLKSKYLADRNYWLLNILVRMPGDETKGAISQLVKPYLMRAKKEGVPVMLEASSLHSKAIYEHYGFKFYEEFRLGKGKVRVDDDGTLVEDENGSGIPQYFMIYNN